LLGDVPLLQDSGGLQQCLLVTRVGQLCGEKGVAPDQSMGLFGFGSMAMILPAARAEEITCVTSSWSIRPFA
jgi:hypothetical protein